MDYHKNFQRTRRQTHKAEIKAYMKKYRQKPEFKQYMRNYKRGNQSVIDISIAWNKANRETMRELSRQWALENRDKRTAHNTLYKAVKKGEVYKPSSCSACNKKGIIHGHHEDYNKPLDVVWLCPLCHGKKRWLEKTA
jgi:methylphosphotriester-DNA--protein-cysteine methyltransferase